MLVEKDQRNYVLKVTVITLTSNYIYSIYIIFHPLKGESISRDGFLKTNVSLICESHSEILVS